MSTAKISAAFVKAQREFGPALKTMKNDFFHSRYADLATCVEAVIDGLHNNGIAFAQRVFDCVDGVIVETVLIHESGECLKFGKLRVPAGTILYEKDERGKSTGVFLGKAPATAQETCSALTYARRYSLMAACGIAPEDDDGNSASPNRETPKAKPKAETDEDWISQRMVRANIAIIKDAILNENQDGLRKIVAGIEAKHKVAIAKGLSTRELAAVKSVTVKESVEG